MSVRRLAEEAAQPAGFAFTEKNAAWAEATIKKYPDGRQQSAVIPLLMRAQDQDGWVTKAAIEHVAAMLDMPLIRVLEVATFYTQFQLNPVGTKAHVQVCGTTPCMLRGAEDLKAICRKKIHAEPFHRNEAGTLSWEEVECLGACVNAPMVMVFQDTYEDLTPERLEEIIDLFDAGRGDEVQPGPQNGRHLSAPLGGLTSLNGDYDDLIEPNGYHAANGAGAKRSAGGSAATPPSEAGRPNTESEETDPTMSAPGAASAAKVDPKTEHRQSDALAAEGHAAGAGREGGARQGATDVDDPKRPTQPAGTGPAIMEGERTRTTDTKAGPTQDDHFDSKAEGAKTDSRPGEKPAGLLSQPQGDKDDLKKIRGVGPVAEGKLNELGVYHFSQIAAWREVELVWVDDYLEFRGRAVREGWIGQAKDLQGSAQNGDGEA
ncbi:NADH-quinone oxidoreductase subunit NuoE [Jiella sp. MQZ9-1]|uniref:NADH-quinone oxidoreductase subunit NuoE n=1 Tax=Jiella flava TaxID=2816857 RepID=A0A939G2C5_9HYPH|nr:NADH-quinone oxidoreductase subunit NuoE [Jiella flava]MBO0663794.1 NADH-quinone oxidoreductase subunit NuoE [Jiella flava]MCD2472367.1 NADH-quinone oxidoreductase subunit NuoE [Jiella flava]